MRSGMYSLLSVFVASLTISCDHRAPTMAQAPLAKCAPRCQSGSGQETSAFHDEWGKLIERPPKDGRK